jgi:hypothetical protein
MFDDDLERLRQDPRAIELLAYYAALGTPDRSVWQKRLGTMEGIDAKELSRLHGELIAFDWIEQNPSRNSAAPGSVQAGVYRITSHGVRDLCQVQGVEVTEGPEEPEKAKPRFPSRKKKQKSAEAERADGASVPATISEAAA